jgi:hypothetical protein
LEQEKMESRKLADNMISIMKKEIAIQHDKMLKDVKSEIGNRKSEIGTLMIKVAKNVRSS